jgi:hypothetical protein
VADVHGIAAGAAASVQQEVFSLLVLVQNELQVAVGEEQASPQPAVRLVAGHALEALEQGVVDELGGPLCRDGGIVELLDIAVGVGRSLYVPRVDFLGGGFRDGLCGGRSDAEGSHRGRFGLCHGGAYDVAREKDVLLLRGETVVDSYCRFCLSQPG